MNPDQRFIAAQELTRIMSQIQTLEKQAQELREKLLPEMVENKTITTVDGTVTYIRGYEASRFDVKEFKKTHQRLFKKFTIKTSHNPRLMVMLKKEE